MVNMSTAEKKQRNKDLGPWSLVLSVLALAIAFHTPKAYSQNVSSAQPVPTMSLSPDIEDADDNGSDDSEESDDEVAPDVNMEDENSDPVAEQPPAEPEKINVPQEPQQSDIKFSDADMVEVIPADKTVDVEPFKDYESYRQRRTTHGFMFNLNAENLYFQDYISIVDQKLYEELFGQEDLTLAQVQVDYKLNFFLGSLLIGVGFGQGTLVDDRFVDPTTKLNQERVLTIAKRSARLQLLFDSLLKEPYFVPYVGINYWQFGITEENKTLNTKNSYDTGTGTSMTVGFLVQLNWMDAQTAKLAYMGEGLENTYLDVFWTQYQNTDNELDPIFENDFNFGVGLRLEF